MSKSFRSQILFSATLSPLSYYRDMIGAAEEDYSLTVSSPFQKEQWEVTVLPVSTRYHDREASLVPLTKALSQMVSKKGNYLVFFPSYLYLQNVYQAFTEYYPEIRTLMQDTGMSEQARESFLAAFSPDNDETLLGFAVLGGIFQKVWICQGIASMGLWLLALACHSLVLNAICCVNILMPEEKMALIMPMSIRECVRYSKPEAG